MREDLTNAADAATLAQNQCNELLQRADGGDQNALHDLRRLFHERPELEDAAGNIALQAWLSWADVAAGYNEVLKRALLQHMESWMLELSGPSPTQLERLLITRVVVCWVQIHYFERMCAQTTKITLQQGEYFQRSLDRAHRRYLSAIRNLAAVRRLQVPTAVQVNIGGQHVNVLDTGAEAVTKDR